MTTKALGESPLYNQTLAGDLRKLLIQLAPINDSQYGDYASRSYTCILSDGKKYEISLTSLDDSITVCRDNGQPLVAIDAFGTFKVDTYARITNPAGKKILQEIRTIMEGAGEKHSMTDTIKKSISLRVASV